LAAQLTERWTHSVWRPVSLLLATGPDYGAPRPQPARRRRQLQVRLTDHQSAALAADYAAGASIATVSAKYHVDPETAARHIKLAGVPTRQFVVGISPDEVPRLLELRAQGWTLKQIGKLYDCSHTSVRNALLRATGSTQQRSDQRITV
jgi:DNA-directed RNA polymerase specialized sigma24 family protein